MKQLGLVFISIIVAGCATFSPEPYQPIHADVVARALSDSDGAVTARVSVLADEEARAVFGTNLRRKGIQPVWLEITNLENEDLWLSTLRMDPDYFSPREAAWAAGARFAKGMEEHFAQFEMPIRIETGQIAEGYVFTSHDVHSKALNITLVGDEIIREIEMILAVPAKRDVDYQRVDFASLYASIEDLTLEEFRARLAALPCCVTSTDGARSGDPVNVAFVGSAEQLYTSLVQAGWDETQTLTAGTAVKTAFKGVFGGRYKHSPVSPLLFFDRPQDAAFQIARDNIHLRNHMRIWMAPWTVEGQQAWLGQISRDIGVRFTRYSPYLTTHKIDPDIDEARYALLQQLALSQRVDRLGYVEGSLKATPDAPGYNATMDPMWSDGLRAVFFFSDEPTPLDELDIIWNAPLD